MEKEDGDYLAYILSYVTRVIWGLISAIIYLIVLSTTVYLPYDTTEYLSDLSSRSRPRRMIVAGNGLFGGDKGQCLFYWLASFFSIWLAQLGIPCLHKGGILIPELNAGLVPST